MKRFTTTGLDAKIQRIAELEAELELSTRMLRCVWTIACEAHDDHEDPNSYDFAGVVEVARRECEQ